MKEENWSALFVIISLLNYCMLLLAPPCIPEYMYTHCDLVFTMPLDINAYF